MGTKCKFCGNSGYGYCMKSPVKLHKHGSDGKHCIWCGSSSTGACVKSPHKKHER